MVWDTFLRMLRILMQGLLAAAFTMTNASMLYRSYVSVDFIILATCSVVFAVRPLDRFRMFDLMVPCMFCTALLPFCIQMHNLDAVGTVIVAGITLVFILQFRSKTLPKTEKYVHDEDNAFLYIQVNLNIAWGFIPVVCTVQCIFMYVFGGLDIFKCWWIEVLLFQGTFLMFTFTLSKFMAMEQGREIATRARTGPESELQYVNTNQHSFQYQTGITSENFMNKEYKALPREVSFKDLHGTQLVLDHGSTWWAFWPIFVGIFCLVMLCVYEHRGSFGYFSAFSCDMTLSCLLLLAFYIAVNHATKFWQLKDEKTAQLLLMIAVVIIMVGDIDVTPAVKFTMPEVLVTWFCICTGNSVQVALWAIAKFKTILTARKTHEVAPGVEETTSIQSYFRRWIWAWVKFQVWKQLQMYLLDFLKNELWKYASTLILSFICKMDFSQALSCSNIV